MLKNEVGQHNIFFNFYTKLAESSFLSFSCRIRQCFGLCHVLFFQQTISHMCKRFTEWGHCVTRAPTTLKSEGEVTSLSGADKREVRDNREKWWEYREKSKYFSNCTTFHIRRALSWHLYVIMYLLCIKVYSVVV